VFSHWYRLAGRRNGGKKGGGGATFRTLSTGQVHPKNQNRSFGGDSGKTIKRTPPNRRFNVPPSIEGGWGIRKPVRKEHEKKKKSVNKTKINRAARLTSKRDIDRGNTRGTRTHKYMSGETI